MVELKAKDIRLVPISDIRPNPKNRNNHSPEQIERLCKIIKYQGFRSPLIVSNRTGLLVAGHGRIMAATKLGMTQVPVSYQDFESEEQEYAAGVSDNAVAAWSELDLAGINTDIADLGPNMDLEMLGLQYFNIDPPMLDEKDKPDTDEIKYRIQLEFPDDGALMELYTELSGRGYIVKKL